MTPAARFDRARERARARGIDWSLSIEQYAELLASGYTHVCEFHYLHNDVDGRPYADAGEMANALVRAAQQVGIGLTLLPTFAQAVVYGVGGWLALSGSLNAGTVVTLALLLSRLLLQSWAEWRRERNTTHRSSTAHAREPSPGQRAAAPERYAGLRGQCFAHSG